MDAPAGTPSPPVHVHHRTDEGFYVLRGTYGFLANGERVGSHVLRSPLLSAVYSSLEWLRWTGRSRVESDVCHRKDLPEFVVLSPKDGLMSDDLRRDARAQLGPKPGNPGDPRVISPHLHTALVRAKMDDFERTAASRYRPERPSRRSRRAAIDGALLLRLASPADEGSLARLAELDSSRAPVHPVLLGLVNGEPRAALSLADGTHVADPFRRTAELIDLLRARAEQLEAANRNESGATSPLRAPAWRQLAARIVPLRR